MVKLTASQKKKLKLHAVNQSASHMKKMVKLMRAGDSFSEAHASASKKSVKQQQKQKQSQKVVINLAPSRRRAAPRQTARPNTSRVLQQFAQPTAMLPQQQYTIYPVSLPPAFQRIQSPVLTNQFAPRPDGVVEGRILGRAPVDTPLDVRRELNTAPTQKEEQRSMKIEEIRSRLAERAKLTSGRQQPDNTASQGRTLLPDAGVSSLSETEPEPFTPRFARGSATETGLGRVEESDDESFGGTRGKGGPSPSLVRLL